MKKRLYKKLVVAKSECIGCNRVVLQTSKHSKPEYGKVTNVYPTKKFSYEVRLEKDNYVVFCRPEHIINVLPCEIHETLENERLKGVNAVEGWLQK